MIVSDIAGTTRDAVDTRVKWQGKDYIFIDTAGLRRKGKVKEEIERYSVIRTVTAVERADVVIVMIDASEGVTEQDAKIAGIAHERGKGVIIAVNKYQLRIWHIRQNLADSVCVLINSLIILFNGIPFIYSKNRTQDFQNV